MPHGFTLVALALLVIVSSTLGGVIGFGTAAILLPIFSLIFGLQVAVPVLGIAMIFANLARVVFSWREIDWKAVGAFAIGSLPASIVGALLFVGASGRWLNVAIATFILLAVPMRRLGQKLDIKVVLKHLPILGAAVGLISGMGGIVGPASSPFLLAYGLTRGSYLGTDGMNSVIIHGVKRLVSWHGGSTNAKVVGIGLSLGALMVLGSFLGRKLVDRLDERTFTLIVETFLIILGIVMLGESIYMR